MAYSKRENELSYIAKYQKDNYDRITVMADKGKKEKYQAAAKIKGLSLSAFVMACVDEQLKKMQEQFNKVLDSIV